MNLQLFLIDPEVFPMRSKFANQHPASKFEPFRDPFRHRRGQGPLRPKEPLECACPDYLREFPRDTFSFSWLGHSSVFLNMDGRNILIDPVFSKRTSPVPFLGPKRFAGRVITPEELPEIDLVVITHNHYDHLDKATVLSLDHKVKHYAAPTGVGQNLRSFGIAWEKISELAWYEEKLLDGLTVICTPSQHNSMRSLFDIDRTLWGSFLLKSEHFTVFDTGDGGFSSHFSDIRKRYGAPDLAVMECGQYGESWHRSHMFPEESAEASRILGAKLSIPVHWGAYVLSDHPWDDPPKRYRLHAEELGLPFRIPKLYEIIPIL